MNAPKLASDLPLYPPTQQLLRVTSTTIAGPAGGASAGLGTGNIAPTVLYVASTQQMRTDTLAPRDREPCLVTEPNGRTLTAGYYHGRLSGNYNGLPVYSVVMDASSGGGGSDSATPYLPWEWMTDEQRAFLEANLSEAQLNNLNNLNACQLQVLLQLPIGQIQLLTTNLTPTQLTHFLDGLNYTQLINLTTNLNISQITSVTSAYPNLYELIHQSLTQSQISTFLTNLTAHQISTLIALDTPQLQTIAQLTTPQLQFLTDLTTPQVTDLVGQLNAAQLGQLLDTLNASQLQQLANNYTPSQIEDLFQAAVPVSRFHNLVNLTPTQADTLLSLNAAQLQTISQLTQPQIQSLVGNLSALQLGTVLDTLTFTQLSSLSTNLSNAQVVVASSAYPQLFQLLNQALTTTQANTLLGNLSSQQLSTLVALTTPQLQAIAQLTTPQIQTLTSLTTPQVSTLVGQLTTAQISALLTALTTPQLQQLTNNYTGNQIQQLAQSGIPTAQLGNLVTLTPTQAATLLSLDDAQLQTIAQLTPQQVQQLTGTLGAGQLGTILDTLTFTQLSSLANNLSSAQVVVAASAYPQTYQLLSQALTTAQVNSILGNLSSQQFSTLNPLTAPQLKTIASLTTPQLQTLTNLTAIQVGTLVGENTTAQLASLLDLLTHSQLQKLTNNLTSDEISDLLQSLTAAQIQTATANLTPTQLRNLAGYDTSTISALVNGFSIGNLASILNISPSVPTPIAGNQGLYPYLPTIVGQPSSVPNPGLGGYSPIVVDNTGKVWSYINGVWSNLSGNTSGVNVTNYPNFTPGAVPTWVKFSFNYTDLAVAATSTELVIGQIPATAIFQLALMEVPITFSGECTTLNSFVGVDSNNSALGAAVIDNVQSEPRIATGFTIINWGMTDTLKVYFTSGSGNLDQLTAGSAVIYFLISNPQR